MSYVEQDIQHIMVRKFDNLINYDNKKFRPDEYEPRRITQQYVRDIHKIAHPCLRHERAYDTLVAYWHSLASELQRLGYKLYVQGEITANTKLQDIVCRYYEAVAKHVLPAFLEIANIDDDTDRLKVFDFFALLINRNKALLSQADEASRLLWYLNEFPDSLPVIVALYQSKHGIDPNEDI